VTARSCDLRSRLPNGCGAITTLASILVKGITPSYAHKTLTIWRAPATQAGPAEVNGRSPMLGAKVATKQEPPRVPGGSALGVCLLGAGEPSAAVLAAAPSAGASRRGRRRGRGSAAARGRY